MRGVWRQIVSSPRWLYQPPKSHAVEHIGPGGRPHRAALTMCEIYPTFPGKIIETFASLAKRPVSGLHGRQCFWMLAALRIVEAEMYAQWIPNKKPA